jgi:hypothetical protein
MKTEIIPDEEQSLDELVVRARKDPFFKQLKKRKEPSDILIYSTPDAIYALIGKEIEVVKGHPASSFIYHVGQLLCVHNNKIINLTNGKTYDAPDEFEKVNYICALPGIVIAGKGKNQKGIISCLFRIANDLGVLERDTEVTALCEQDSSEDIIYDGTADGIITKTIQGKSSQIIYTDPDKNSIDSLCCIGRQLYAGIGDNIYYLKAHKNAPSNELVVVAHRATRCYDLSLFNGKLVDACGWYGVRYTETSEILVREHVRAMTAIPYAGYWRLMSKKK